VLHGGGSEEVEDKVRHIARAKFIIRKRSGISNQPDLQVLYNGRVFHVYYVEEIGRTHLSLHSRFNDE